MDVDAVAALDGGTGGQVPTPPGDDRPDGAQGPTRQAGHCQSVTS